MSVDSALLGGRYRLEGLIGRGGMASVWRATDTILERPVAVKRLHARLHDDPELAERFRREGQAVARLSHPNLVRLLDRGQEGDEPFLVFELVEGRDLKTIIRHEGRLPADEAASICGQIARALAAAHTAGVVHRDIKSHNVLVTPEGMAKLTDFGIARIVETEGASLTRAGIVMGSSDYLAPEQAEGRGVDPRGDVYSLGVVLFEALTGTLPFAGENAVAVATKHVYEAPPDPRVLAPDLPGHLAEACLRSLAKRPRDRFDTADGFADAIEGRDGETVVRFHDPVTGRLEPARRPRRSRKGAAAAAAAVVVVGGGLAAWQAGLLPGAAGGDVAGGSAGPLAFTLADHDPAGGDGEHPETVALARDRNQVTAWTTESYKSPDLGGKGGVGLLVTLQPAARVTAVRLASTTPGGRVQILGPGSDEPGGREVLGEGALPSGAGEISVTSPAALGEIVVWLTELPEAGSGGLRYRASIGEVEVRGVANR